MAFRGAEMLLEIARFWATRSTYNPKRARYEIKNVVGPDEFHVQYPGSSQAGIDNNAYTNFMASWSLKKALYILDSLDQERRSELEVELQITPDEVRLWNDSQPEALYSHSRRRNHRAIRGLLSAEGSSIFPAIEKNMATYNAWTEFWNSKAEPRKTTKQSSRRTY